MGRAYPTKWQTTPVVFNERPCVFCPIATADGNGNLLYMPTAVSDLAVERIIRAALSQMGISYLPPILSNTLLMSPTQDPTSVAQKVR